MFILFHLILSLSFCLSFIPYSKWRFAHTSLHMKQYEYAKEYFEFYKKYKKPILQQSQSGKTTTSSTLQGNNQSIEREKETGDVFEKKRQNFK